MKAFKNQAAQGDMLITKIGALPKKLILVEPENDHYVVTHSETGHNHVVPAQGVTMYQAANDPFVAYLAVDNKVELKHLRSFDTHESLQINPGLYRINRQREYTPEGFRRAQD